jgi:hypothetical protein
MVRRVRRAVLWCAVAFGCLGPAAGTAGAVIGPSGQLPIMGWCGPPASFVADAASAAARVAEYRNAGFNLLGPLCGQRYDVPTNHRVLTAAANAGIKVLVDDQRVQDAVDSGSTAQLDQVIADFASYPAVGGYFVRDEPPADEFSRVATVVAYLRAHDPAHPAYVDVLPEWAFTTGYWTYLNDFLTTTGVSVLSYNEYKDDHFFTNLIAARAEAALFGVPFWQIVLSTQHETYPQPSQAKKLWEGMQTLAYGGKGVGFFTYWTVSAPRWYPAIIGADGSQTSQYSEIAKVNIQLQRIGAALLSTTNRYTFQTGPIDPGGSPRPAGAPARVLSTTAKMTVGTFDDSSYVYTLVANRDPANTQSVPVQLSYGSSLPEQLTPSGWSTVSPTSTGGGVATVSTTLGAGDGVLYRARTPVAPNDPTLVGSVRNNAGTLWSVDPVGGYSSLGPTSWSQCPGGYTFEGRDFQPNGFWLCVRNDLVSRGFYVGNVVANAGTLWRVQGGNALRIGQFGWGTCPSSATPAGQLLDSNGFAVCMDAAGRLGPEALYGTVRNNAGRLYVVDSTNGVTDSGAAGWNSCGAGYSYTGRQLDPNGFWLCARNDLVNRTFYAGNVVSNAGYFWSLLNGSISYLGLQYWNYCPSSQFLGRVFDPNGFWLCLQ